MNEETKKPLSRATDAKLERVRQLTHEEVKAPAPYFIIGMANMSRTGCQIFQVSSDGGQHWGDIKPPIGPNCQYNTVDDCNLHNQWSPMATVNCGWVITLAIRWRKPDGSTWEGHYPGTTAADCNNYAGTLYGFVDQ